MRRAMASWRFPYHFIDFETSAVAIPFHQGMRPYEQVAFQYSHHVMHEDGRVEHKGQFLLAERGVSKLRICPSPEGRAKRGHWHGVHVEPP
mgnify:CR=1 FL=1